MTRLTLILLAACLAVLSVQTVSAQDELSGPKGIERKNVIKINPISPVLRNVFLGYERVLNDKFSAQLTVGYMKVSAGSLPGPNIDVIELDDEGYTTFDAGAVTLKGFTIMPEARMYLSNKRTMPRGFYFGPYIRYQSHTLSAPPIEYKASYTDPTTNTKFDIDTTLFNAFDIKMSSFGAGLTWGWQAMIAQRVTLEWNMGAGFKSSKLDMPTVMLQDPITGEKEDVFGELEDQGNDIINIVPVGVRFGFTLGVAF